MSLSSKSYASSRYAEKVKQCIREKINPYSIVRPNDIMQLRGAKDFKQALTALRNIAPESNTPYDIGAESKLFRGYLTFGIWWKGEADFWYYACPIERLPFFPVIVSAFHEILRKWFPLIHSLAHSSEALESSPRGARCTIKTY